MALAVSLRRGPALASGVLSCISIDLRSKSVESTS